jgi:hypothetical protein
MFVTTVDLKLGESLHLNESKFLYGSDPFVDSMY